MLSETEKTGRSDMVTLSPSESLLKLYELAKSLGYRLGTGIVNCKFKVVMIKGDREVALKITQEIANTILSDTLKDTGHVPVKSDFIRVVLDYIDDCADVSAMYDGWKLSYKSNSAGG